jgi:hypothetical protein
VNVEVTAHHEIPKDLTPTLNKPGIHTGDQRQIGADAHRGRPFISRCRDICEGICDA